MPRLENSAGPSHPRLYRLILYCLRCTLQPSATGNKLISKRYQHFREHGLPYGLHDSLCTLHLFCSTLNICLRHRCNTRYGWLARPYPTGSFTLQDAPSCAWRANVSLHMRPLFWGVVVKADVLPQRSSCIEIARSIPSISAFETVPARSINRFLLTVVS